MLPLMRTLSTTNTQHPSSTPPNQTSSLKCALHQHLTLNTYHPTNMFPQMRTSSTPNTQYPSPVKHVPQMRSSSTPNTQHPSPVKHVPPDAHIINTHHSASITRQTSSLRCALHQHPSLNTQHPKFNTQHPSKAPHTLRDNTLHLSANTTG